MLSMRDSSTAMEWLWCINIKLVLEFEDDTVVKQKVARKLAEIILEVEAVLYRQWFDGESDLITDGLSCNDVFLDHATQLAFLNRVVPQQLPKNFRILPVLSVTSSFITLTLQLLPVHKQ